MAGDVLINKAAIIERCVARAREEYQADPAGFAGNLTRQDAAILKIQRACEAALDMGQYLIRREKLGVPQSPRDVFALLAQAGWIDESQGDELKRMVGFPSIALHANQSLPLLLRLLLLRVSLPTHPAKLVKALAARSLRLRLKPGRH